MLKNKLLAIALVSSTAFFSCTKFAQKDQNASGEPAENSKYFYYYQGKKVPLILNTGYIYVVSKKSIEGSYKNLGVITGSKKVETNKITLDQTHANPQTNGISQQAQRFTGKLKLSKKVSAEEYGITLNQMAEDPDVQFVEPVFDYPPGPQGNGNMTVSEYFYVKLQSENDVQTLYNVAASYGVSVVSQHETMPLWYVLACTNGSQSSISMANAFYQSGLFIFAEPDFMLENALASCPADTKFPLQWGSNNTGQSGGTAGIDIRGCQALDLTGTGYVIDVAVIDDAVNKSHPDLVSTLYGPIQGRDWSVSGNVSIDHGTKVSGILCARENGFGITGVAPNCRLMSYGVALGAGVTDQTTKILSTAIDLAWQQGASVINCSWYWEPASIIDDAIFRALTQGRGGIGCVVVFAAGNQDGPVAYPANRFSDILVAGAINPCGKRVSISDCANDSWGSNYGKEVDVVAPGTKISTTGWPTSGLETDHDYTDRFDGTSAAAPVVAGVAALILSKNPTLSGWDVRNIIESTAQKVGGYSYGYKSGRYNGTWHQEMGYGLVNAAAAVQATPVPSPGSTIGRLAYVDAHHTQHIN